MTTRLCPFVLCAAVAAACGGTSPPPGPAHATTPAASTQAPAPRCEPVTCKMYCEHGFVQDANGCEVCECAAGCEPVLCELYCDNGYAQDAQGCEVCACK